MIKTIVKLILIGIIFTFSGCSCTKFVDNNINNFDITKEINNEILEGFFNGDSTNVPQGTYFLR